VSSVVLGIGEPLPRRGYRIVRGDLVGREDREDLVTMTLLVLLWLLVVGWKQDIANGALDLAKVVRHQMGARHERGLLRD
jgi:hypothetical protein